MYLLRANLFPGLVALGAFLVASGAFLVLRAQRAAESTGWWTSYSAPEDGIVLLSETQVLSAAALWGAAVIVTGVLVLVGAFGYVAGLARGRRDGAGPDASAQEPTDG